jgi:hypothetical protein
MTELSLHQPQRLSRKANLALTIAIILGTIEILRRTPTWLLFAFALLLCWLVLLAIVYIWWIIGALGAVIGWKLGRGFVQGWRASR